MDKDDVARVAGMLTEAQRDFVLSHTIEERTITAAEWDAMPELYVQFTPDEYCETTGVFLGGGDMIWFGAAHAHSPAGSPDWIYAARLNERGVALRAHLQAKAQSDAE